MTVRVIDDRPLVLYDGGVSTTRPDERAYRAVQGVDGNVTVFIGTDDFPSDQDQEVGSGRFAITRHRGGLARLALSLGIPEGHVPAQTLLSSRLAVIPENLGYAEDVARALSLHYRLPYSILQPN